MNMILAGDIGGTKTHLAIFSATADLHNPIAEATFPSMRYTSLEAIIQEFLAHTRLTVTSACFGVAGPVIAGQAHITNLPWVIDTARLHTALNIPSTTLLNDLEAIAHAVPVLEAADVHTLNRGVATPEGTIAVIAPGTGLGEAFLTWDGTRYRAYASEGGHTSFAPSNQTELNLLTYLWERYEHVSYERVCSGLGLPNIYAYFRDSSDTQELPWVSEQLSATHDPTPVIVNAALHPETPSPLCHRTLETFVRILGAEAGNLALKMMATGGLYLGGGIPPRILGALESMHFFEAFSQKGRFADLLSRIPVHVIRNPRIALLGAAQYGFEKDPALWR